MLGGFLEVIVYSILCVLFLEFTHFNYLRDATTGGARIPYWMILAIVLFGVFLLAIYSLADLVKKVKGSIAWKSQ